MNSKADQTANDSIRGYLEGYYGKLLSWSERDALLHFLSAQNLNTYCYAPKEDVQHRLQWREAYSPRWLESFRQFSHAAQTLKVAVVAGIAPGLDFNFDNKDNTRDFDRLCEKANAFVEGGANHILVLWDDIDAGCFVDSGVSEGAAHAGVVNLLSENLGQPVWTVPRVYAAQIENNNNYLEDFFAELQPQHIVLLCGKAIVSQNISLQDLRTLSCTPDSTAQGSSSSHRVVLWDNFYANDYCPRQLFLGPWTGREQINDYLINPTGLPYTDRLLLDIALSTHTSTDCHKDWAQALTRHGVPDAFQAIAPYFDQPFFGDRLVSGDERDINCVAPNNEIAQAIETCLWKWKSPLAREWYPYIMSLKHDLALMQGELPRDRTLKTQSPALAKRLLS